MKLNTYLNKVNSKHTACFQANVLFSTTCSFTNRATVIPKMICPIMLPIILKSILPYIGGIGNIIPVIVIIILAKMKTAKPKITPFKMLLLTNLANFSSLIISSLMPIRFVKVLKMTVCYAIK